MKYNSRRAAFILAASFLFAVNASGQTRSDVIKLYNDGVKAIQTNIDSAILKFEDVIKMSGQVGETADDLKQNAIQSLPGLYLKSASGKLSGKKPPAEVISATRLALASAEKYGNEPVKENAGKILLQAYNRMATEFASKKDYEKALSAFDSVLIINPDYLSAIYNKALIYRIQNNPAAFEETIDMYIAKAEEKDKAKASTLGLEYFRGAGAKANQAGTLDEALNLLNKAAKYGEDKDLFYYYADVYNKQSDYDKAAEFAAKGLGLETGAAEAKAKFHFQIGIAQASKGQTAEACESFKNSSYGAFAEASKVQRTNLKCN
jgi:tetratricopeptide (TPR) repeat protein